MQVHIYTAPRQKATRFVDEVGGKRIVFRNKPNRLLTCNACYRHRPAKNLVVQVYYDHISYWCADGKGCKKPINTRVHAWCKRKRCQK